MAVFLPNIVPVIQAKNRFNSMLLCIFAGILTSKSKIFTSMYSFFVQGKHLRNPTIAFRLGPIELTARIFTERIDDIKLVGNMFCGTESTYINKINNNLNLKKEKKKTDLP